jgi:hypothetical protein
MRQHLSEEYRTLSQEQKVWREEVEQRFIHPEQLSSKEPKTEISWDPAAGDQTVFRFFGIMTWNRSVAHELLADPDYEVAYIMTKDEVIVHPGGEIDDTVVELYGRAASEIPLTTGDLLWRLSQKVEFLNPERMVVGHCPGKVEESA